MSYHNFTRATAEDTHTHFQFFTGPKTLNPRLRQGASLKNDSDLSNLFLIAEAADSVPWTQPVDMVVRNDSPLPLPSDRFLVAMADGVVRQVDRSKISDEVLRLYLDPSHGKEPPPLE
jgi:hypothetical protein